MAVDVVVIGHVTLDQTPRGPRPGGAAYYSAITAHRQGLRVGVLTSFGPDFPLDALPRAISVVNVPSRAHHDISNRSWPDGPRPDRSQPDRN